MPPRSPMHQAAGGGAGTRGRAHSARRTGSVRRRAVTARPSRSRASGAPTPSRAGVVPAADDRRTRRAQGDIDGTTDQGGHRRDAESDRHRAPYPDRQRAEAGVRTRSVWNARSPRPGRTHRSDAISSPPRASRSPPLRPLERDLDRLLVGAVEPERHHHRPGRDSQHRRVGRLVEEDVSGQLPRSPG